MLKSFFTVFGVFGLVAILMIFSGCGKNISSDISDKNEVSIQNQIIKNRPEREADITGIVKSIVGNEVVITQVDMDAIREQMAENMPEGIERPEGVTNNFVSTGGQPPAGSGMGGPGGGRPGEGTGNSEMREQMNEMMRANSLGDVKVLIPVGIPMYTRGAEASLADLKVESNITIWLDQTITDRKIAEFVTL